MSGSELVPGGAGGPGGRVPPDARAQPAEQDRAAEEVMDIHGLIGNLRRHIGLVMAVTALTTAFAANLAFNRVPAYRASGLLRVSIAAPAVPARVDEEVAKAVYSTGTNPLLSELEVLRGREVLGEVVDRAGLRLQAAPGGLGPSQVSGVSVAAPRGESRPIRLAFAADGVEATSGAVVARARYGEPIELPGVRFTVRARPQLPSAELAIHPRDGVIGHLGSSLITRPRDKTDVVAVEYTSPDPAFAQRVVNTAMVVFQEASASTARRESRRRRVLLEEQVRGGDSALVEMQDSLARSRGAEPAREVALVEQVKTAAALGTQLRQELQRARIAEAREPGQVEIVHAAPLPAKRMGTGGALKLALGVVMGLALGAAGALLREGLSRSVKRLSEIEALLGIPALALIPRIGPRVRLTAALSSAAADPDEGRLAAAFSPGAEAFRTLRTHLALSPVGRTVRVLAVTSASTAEGTTTVAANLAVAYARQGLRVAVVDCNLRKARLHLRFGVPREPGLAACLLGHAPLDGALRETSIERLHILPAGAPSPDAAELLGGERMRETLELLAARFDRVVLDTPPLLAAADASILATLADGVLVVVRAGHTDRAAAQRAAARLSTAGANVVGGVLNDPDSKADTHDTPRPYGDDIGSPGE